MKIEKVNDHQIRCTLTKADLADRELKLSELAYGTEKAKSLFRDMMQQASFEFGFEAEDIPLMIEAIPLNPDCIVLIITKVEDPEELDTRFSKFAPAIQDEDDDTDIDEMINNLAEGAADVLDLFKKIKNREPLAADNTASQTKADTSKAKQTSPVTKEEPATENVNLTKVFSFQSIGEVTRLAHVLKNYYTGENSLYKNNEAGKYLLVLSKSNHTPEEFNKICNILSEYGNFEKCSSAGEAFLDEHFDAMIRDNALQALASM
ncbi:MAG: adaptor protein MecA [Lachnospiraceae bacterium]|nr:adaptor protein MecA [Lachnospiraceae bacterium]